MEEPRTLHFDSRGFAFALQCGILICIVFAGVRYGTAYASDVIVAAAEENLAEMQLKLEEVKAKRTMRSIGEMNLLKELQKYEETLSTRSIGTASIDTLSLAHEKMVGADLTNMKLYLYENGYAVKTIDILSKGKRGSQWETPTGLYKIETKEQDHFSSIGEVHMPYSMQFFGNFFVHGWPYYPDGTPVAPGFSGGCIRLATDDARLIYEFVTPGTPIFVWEDSADDAADFEVTSAKPPYVSAKSYIVADIRTGEVYAEKDADTSRPIASLSKLMTALVANETIHYGRTLTINRDDRTQTEGTPGAITSDDTFTVGDLLFPLLMESNNSVAYTLARYYGSENFLEWMNDKARAIGMQDAHFEDPSGISEKNVASASDLFKFMRYIHDSQSYILNVTRLKDKSIKAEDGSKYTLANFNHFADNKQFLGGKTGYTDAAHETMTAVFELPLKNATATVAIVVLASEDRKGDVETLLAWFKRNAKAE